MADDDSKLFGYIAEAEGLVDREQIEDALATQMAMAEMGVGKRLGEVLRYKGHMTRSHVSHVLRIQGLRQVPSRIAGFQVIEKIGRGGMGDVYRALQINMERVVALKLASSTQSSHIKRMMREARWLGRLSHPNIIQGFDMGEFDGHFYFAMEYVKGQTLHRLILHEGTLPERRAVSLVLQVARAIGALWNERIVHRDIKPGNIMVTDDGVAKVCDLGLAIDVRRERHSSLDEPGTAVGTPYYMSPEQVESKVLADVRSDMYSLGTTLYRMVVGNVPFSGATRAIILSKHVFLPLPWPKKGNPALSDDICLLIAKMMAKDRNNRYQTVDQLVLDLEDFLAGRSPRIASAAAPFWMPQAKLIRDDSLQHSARLGKLRAFARLRQTCAALSDGDRKSFGGLCGKLAQFAGLQDAQTHLKTGMLFLANGDDVAAVEAFAEAAAIDLEFAPFAQIVPSGNCPENMVYAPATLPQEGDDAAEAKPARGGFYIDESLVTNRQYGDFVAATQYPAPDHWAEHEWDKEFQDMPVTHVSWHDSVAYARWRRARLPTMDEWEFAATGPEPRAYPWGDRFSAERCCCADAGTQGPVPVGTYFGGMSPCGCHDMCGNVWEWTAEKLPSDPQQKAVRGGSWQEGAEGVACTSQTGRDPAQGSPDCGFRCVQDVVITDDRSRSRRRTKGIDKA